VTRSDALLSPRAIADAIAVIDAVRTLDPDDPLYVAIERAASHLNKTAKKKRKLARKHESRARDREATLGSERAASYFAAEPSAEPRALRRARSCYVCKQPFRQLHAFYHMLCPTCAERSARARADVADLAGRRALVTGGRIKVGFEVARALLRAGAHVTVTTRFPRDAERRFADCVGRERLAIVGLDFVDMRGLLAWIDEQRARGEPLDILVNNAAQTISHPRSHYAQLVANEQHALPAPSDQLLDADGLALDLRESTSWTQSAADVAPRELVEVHLINAMAPFLLASRLKPLFLASAFPDRYIVNVSSMEGVFTYEGKQTHHPHTNMAKAALNMFTRTSAADYARDGIYMTSVDPGWISLENPQPQRERVEARGFCPPLDAIDAAARVLAPILRGVRGEPVAGVLFKDFEPAAW
jgi:NAD(P)-dependent dehydrogenase (short-subunit alcohol dehydrogenase family)